MIGKTTPENEADIAALVEELAAAAVGETATYERLSAAVGRDIQSSRWLLIAAMKRMQNDCGAVFGCVRKVGYKRLSVADIPGMGEAARSSLRGKARRARKQIKASLDGANDTTSEQRRRAFAEMSALGLMEHIARSGTDEGMKAETEQRPLPVAIAGRAFMKHIGATE